LLMLVSLPLFLSRNLHPRVVLSDFSVRVLSPLARFFCTSCARFSAPHFFPPSSFTLVYFTPPSQFLHTVHFSRSMFDVIFFPVQQRQNLSPRTFLLSKVNKCLYVVKTFMGFHGALVPTSRLSLAISFDRCFFRLRVMALVFFAPFAGFRVLLFFTFSDFHPHALSGADA